jgi:nucleoside-diphosphate-sugar epimerase
MRILLIGGNGFIGRFAVAALKQQRHALAVFHRGTTAVPAGVDEIRGNRNQLKASAQELKHFAPFRVLIRRRLKMRQPRRPIVYHLLDSGQQNGNPGSIRWGSPPRLWVGM